MKNYTINLVKLSTSPQFYGVFQSIQRWVTLIKSRFFERNGFMATIRKSKFNRGLVALHHCHMYVSDKYVMLSILFTERIKLISALDSFLPLIISLSNRKLQTIGLFPFGRFGFPLFNDRYDLYIFLYV